MATQTLPKRKVVTFAMRFQVFMHAVMFVLGLSTIIVFVFGGATTFVTMAYIIIVNPKILEAAGMPFGPAMVATIISACFGTLRMGVYARRPFAIAPYWGENAFIGITVVRVRVFSRPSIRQWASVRIV